MVLQSNEYADYGHPCPIRDVLDRIGDQWSLLILEVLEVKIYRYNELHREIGDISRQMLSQTLKKLERDGYIFRTVYPEVPVKVEYRLSPLGISFIKPLKYLISWADENHLLICRSRKEHSGI